MKAEDLRVGNLVNYKGYAIVIGINIDSIEYDSDDSYGFAGLGLVKEIPLTKEWLISLGFEENMNTFKIKANKYWSLSNEKQGYLKIKLNNNGKFIVVNFANKSIILQYVNQLQNLYFSITQNELIIN